MSFTLAEARAAHRQALRAMALILTVVVSTTVTAVEQSHWAWWIGPVVALGMLALANEFRREGRRMVREARDRGT